MTLLRLLRNPDPAELVGALGPVVVPRVVDYCVRRYVPGPALAKVDDLSQRYAGARDRFLEVVRERTSAIYPIIGGPGTGKTCFALALAEHIGREAYAVNVPADRLPSWVRPLDVARLGEVPAGAVVVVDD